MNTHVSAMKTLLILALAALAPMALSAKGKPGPQGDSTPPGEYTPPSDPGASSGKTSKGGGGSAKAGKASKSSEEGESSGEEGGAKGGKKGAKADVQQAIGKISRLDTTNFTLTIGGRQFAVPATCSISTPSVKDDAKISDLKVGDNITLNFTLIDDKETAVGITVKAGKSAESTADNEGETKEGAKAKGKKKKE